MLSGTYLFLPICTGYITPVGNRRPIPTIARCFHFGIGWVIGSVTATREHALVGSYDARMYALSTDAGREVWSHRGRGDATSAALVREDGVYYAERATDARPGQLYRLVAD